MLFDYQKICLDLLQDLPQRQKEIISRRFALQSLPSDGGGTKRETLESIGKNYGITRERVRQIEEDGRFRLKPKTKEYQKIFQYFANQLKAQGDFKKEDLLLVQLGGQQFQNQVFFLLTLTEPFKRVSETKDYFSLWTINPDSLIFAQNIINSFYNKLKEANQPLSLESSNLPSFLASYSTQATARGLKLTPAFLLSCLEISKIIQKTPEGLFGLKDWPEINPRGVKDRAYLVLKKTDRPLHFTEVAKRIEGPALPQTVHNELIKDPRFVLVGRGLYALREWGYEEGYVKDIVFKVLSEAKEPLTKEEVLEKVLKQRLVKENTIFLNLSNKKYFLKNSQGKYIIREA